MVTIIEFPCYKKYSENRLLSNSYLATDRDMVRLLSTNNLASSSFAKA